MKKRKMSSSYPLLALSVPLLRMISPGALLLTLFVSVAAAEGIEVVASQDTDVDVMTRKETANLFLGLGPSNSRLTPFDRSDPQLRERFYRETADLSAASVRAHWAKQVFTGRGRPPAMLSQKEVKHVLSEKPGAVTYVPTEQLPADSKVLLSLESGEQE